MSNGKKKEKKAFTAFARAKRVGSRSTKSSAARVAVRRRGGILFSPFFRCIGKENTPSSLHHVDGGEGKMKAE